MSTAPQGDDDLPRVPVRGIGFFEKKWVPVFFFFATVLSTFYVGVEQGAGFYAMTGGDPAVADILRQASIYTLALIGILATHEAGHWLVSRAHGVQTTLPVFIPMPFGIGTFGAVISQNELAPTRTVLLRIGAAGPIAGGIVAFAVMAAAIATSPIVQLPDVVTEDVAYTTLGNSLGTLALQAIWPREIPAGYDLIATPLFMAAWAGFLLTSINLFPVGQLDGGHIAYAIFGERINRWFPAIAIGVMSLSVLAVPVTGGVAMNYLVFGVLIRAFVSWHPPVPSPEPRLGRGSALLIVASALLFALTFMPAPMSIVF